jgi:hypothetical protein
MAGVLTFDTCLFGSLLIMTRGNSVPGFQGISFDGSCKVLFSSEWLPVPKQDQVSIPEGLCRKLHFPPTVYTDLPIISFEGSYSMRRFWLHFTVWLADFGNVGSLSVTLKIP